jgi:hypothetical protein
VKTKNAIIGDLVLDNEKWPCISGKWGNGALPKGEYKVKKCYFLKKVKGKTEPYAKEGNPWVAPLIPQFDTERTGLLIHPDGNKEGTRGCIGISENDLSCKKKIDRILREKGEFTVVV